MKAAIIVDVEVEATRAIRQAEVGAARTMIEGTDDRLGLCPEPLAADSASHAEETSGLQSGSRHVYVCPAGKVLTSTGTLVNDGATLLYRASKHDCDTCELKPRCCPKMPARKIPRSIYENARDVARDIAKTPRRT